MLITFGDLCNAILIETKDRLWCCIWWVQQCCRIQQYRRCCNTSMLATMVMPTSWAWTRRPCSNTLCCRSQCNAAAMTGFRTTPMALSNTRAQCVSEPSVWIVSSTSKPVGTWCRRTTRSPPSWAPTTRSASSMLSMTPSAGSTATSSRRRTSSRTRWRSWRASATSFATLLVSSLSW
jgi:hypothetical protein